MKRALLIVDLEATCWDRTHHKPGNMETIEIGALRIDAENPDQVREFQTFVRPVRYPVLSNFCKDLTSIRQSDVETADPFPEAFSRFLDWIGDLGSVRLSSWGEYDRKQFLRDCSFHKVPYPFSDDHFNIKKFVANRLHCKPQGMKQILKRTGIELEGTHHRSLDDVRNIWKILKSVTGGVLNNIV